MSFYKKLASLQNDFAFLKKRATPVLWVGTATAVNNLLAFVVNVIAARTLGVEGYGVLSLAFSAATLIGLIGDLGFNLSMIRLFNKHQTDPDKQSILLGTALGVKGLLLALLAVISWPLSDFLALRLGLHSANTRLMAIAFVTGGFLFLWTYLQSYLQAYRSFKRLTAYILAYSVFRLIGLPIAYLFSPQDPLAWLLGTYTVPVLVLILIGVVPKIGKDIASVFQQPGLALDVLKEMLQYSKWVALSGIAYTSIPYVVRFVLATRASVEDVGIFSAGMTFTVAFSTLNTAVRAVLFPQVTALEGREAIERYLRRLVRIAPHYVGFAVLGIVSLGSLQWVVLGEEYRQALPVFLITAGGFAVVVFLSLSTMLIHTMMRPEIEAYIELIRVFFITIGSILVAPSGAIGVAVVFALFMIGGTVVKLLIVRRWVNEL